MAVEAQNTLVKDPFLLNILETSHAARTQTLALLDLINGQPRDASPEPASLEGEPGTDEPQQPSAHVLEVSKSQKQLFSHLANLRSLNRRLAHMVRDTKASTSASRNQVDTLHLNLQNLYYEQRHLRGEIASCENFDHPYMKLPLIPLAEFYARFPDMEAAEVSEEELMRARIEEERRERAELEEQRAALAKRKQALMQENAKRKEELVALDKDLEAFIDAAKPIQKTFEKEY